MSAIIPFPKRNDPSSAGDFPTGKHVLAVYPGTTALYKATVVNGHRKVRIPFIWSSLFCFIYLNTFGDYDVELTTDCTLHASMGCSTIRGRQMSK